MSQTVFLINGEADSRRDMRSILERAGYGVFEVSSFKAAARLVHRNHPLAVIVQSLGDDKPVIRFAKRLWGDPGTRQVPVLFIGNAQPVTSPVESTARVGYLEQPCSPRSLLSELAYLTKPAVEWSARRQ